MAAETKKGTFTSPGGTGAQAVTGVGFTPKLVLFFASNSTADGRTHGTALMAIGAATRDGGSTQQWYMAAAEADAQASSDTAAVFNTTAAFKGMLDSSPTIDSVFTLTSFDADGFTVNWTDLPSVGSQVIHYMALGGADITAARCGSFALSTAAATQNVTVNTGFGQPDLLLFAPTSFTSLGDSTGAGLQMSFGAAISATERRCMSLRHPWSAATMIPASWHVNRALVSYTSSGTAAGAADAEADLSAKGSWPTDGFQLSFADQAANANHVLYVAIKGTFTATIGSGTAPTSAAPQTQDLALASGTPEGALLWGGPTVANAGIDATSSELGGFFIGATDGTSEGSVGITTQDNVADSVTGRFNSTAKAIQFCSPAGTTTAVPDLDSEADASITGANVRLTWNDTDTAARAYSYLLIGSPGSGEITVDLTPATETTAPVARTLKKRATLSPATTAESSPSLSLAKRVTLTPVIEPTTAIALVTRKRISLTSAQTTEAGHLLASRKRITLTPAAETTTPVALSIEHGETIRVTLLPAVDTVQARPLSLVKRITLSPSVETTSAVSRPSVKRVTLAPGAITDAARPLALKTRLTLTPSTEVTVAVALRRPDQDGQLVELGQERTATFTTAGATVATFIRPDALATVLTDDSAATFHQPHASAVFEQASAEIVT